MFVFASISCKQDENPHEPSVEKDFRKILIQLTSEYTTRLLIY